MNRWFVKSALLLLWIPGVLRADERTLAISWVGPEASALFPRQIRVQFTNDAFTPVDWGQILSQSQLIVDGQSYPWTSRRTIQPAGIAPRDQWDGCLWPQDFSPSLPPGRHRCILKTESWESNTVSVHIPVPRSSNLTGNDLWNEFRRLAEAIPDGLPRSCVEAWLTERDGGLPEEGTIRYYVKPGMKIVIPYRSSGGSGENRDRVRGRIRIYHEERFAD